MHRSKSAAAAALLTVLALLPLAAAPVAAGDPSAAAKAEHQRIINYWTAERIASAKPRDFVRTNEGKFVPKAKPGGGGGTGASWTGGGPVVQRTGKVLFTMDGGNWVCSASAITDGSRDPLPDPDRRAIAPTTRSTRRSRRTGPTCPRTTRRRRSAAAERLRLLDGHHPSGGGLVVHSGYATAGGFNTQATIHDFAIAIVAAGTRGTQLDALGTYGIAYPAISTGGTVHAFGYPAAGQVPRQ